jgi:glycosyltransferase involved in cell wall biosynthesis
MASVDVFVPCYNYARFLPECVESVLGQAGVSVRVLIIDDASADNTPEVGRGLGASDPRVEYRRHASNQGHIATYNEGIDWAGADYTLLLSADDVLTPGAFNRAARLMDAHPEVGFVFGRGVTTDRPAFRNHPCPTEYGQKILRGSEFWQISCAKGGNVVSTPTAVVRTVLQKKLGGYRKDLPHTGDMEMWLRFAAHADVGVIDADQGFYRVHGANMHKEMFPERLRVLHQHRDAFEHLFREYGHLLGDYEQLRRTATRSLALGAVGSAVKMFEYGERDQARQFAEIATELDPGVRGERAWKRFEWKQRLGPTLTRALARILRTFKAPPPVDRSPFVPCRVFADL